VIGNSLKYVRIKNDMNRYRYRFAI